MALPVTPETVAELDERCKRHVATIRQLTHDLEAARARIKMLEDAYVKHVRDLAEAKAEIEAYCGVIYCK